MLNESRLLNFISENQKFSLQFFEGQKLIHDLALIHSVKAKGFTYYRDISLTTQPLISLLKSNESFGIFVDAELPYFRYKIEMNRQGQMRSLMLPADFDENPTEITGICRLAKTTPSQQSPYTSIIELDGVNLKDLSNLILKQSYQIDGEVFLSDYSDQSILLTKLPTREEEDLSVKKEWLKIHKNIFEIFKQAHNSNEPIIEAMAKENYMYLSSTEVQFKCNCSLDRMIQGIRSLARGDLDTVFEGSEEIVVNCDYCHKPYKLTRMMLAH